MPRPVMIPPMVIDGQAFPLNGPTKKITPNLPWPREAPESTWKKTRLDKYSATEAIKLVFETPKKPRRVAKKKPLIRVARVTKRFTGCFDPQEVVRIFHQVQTLKGQPEKLATLLSPKNLAKRECRWLEKGEKVKLVGKPYNAVIEKGQVVEGITVFPDDTRGAGASGLWFPTGMLAEIILN